MRINNEDLLEVNGTRATVSLATSTTLKPIWLGHIANYSIQLVFTGTPAGAFSLQASNDVGNPHATADTQMYATVTHWTDITGSSQVVAAAGNHMWNVENTGYAWVRVVWTASGSGTTPVLTNANAFVKGV